MRLTRHTVLTATLLLISCATDDHNLGGNTPPLNEGGSAGSGGAAGSGGSGGGMLGSGGSGGGTQGSGGAAGGSAGTAGPDLGPPSDAYTAFVDMIISTGGVDDGAKCLPRRLQVGTDGNVPCVVAQATFQPPDCGCTEPGFSPAPPGLVAPVRERLQALGQCGGDTGRSCESFCVCQMDQFSGQTAQQCQTSPTFTAPGAGWCYIDPEQGIGDPAQVAGCPPSQARKLRFRDQSTQPGRINFIACAEHTASPSLGPARSGAIGDSCIPSSEAEASFYGFFPTEVSVELGSRQCSTGVCLANHFKGRVTCPYGQEDPNDPSCAVPGTGAPVQVTVDPGDSRRRSPDAVYCSCRCAGPGPGPFCACQPGFTCTPLIDDFGLPASSAVAGSYCIKQGTEYVGTEGVQCDRRVLNCE